jgi:hypothetical protein
MLDTPHSFYPVGMDTDTLVFSDTSAYQLDATERRRGVLWK